MIHLITAVYIVVCVLLVLIVLLQQGKKDGMGTAFGGGSQSVFGARGAETFLEKFTKVLAVFFMCLSLALVYFSTRETSNSLFSKEKAPAQTAPVNSTTSTNQSAAPASPQDAKDIKTSPANVPAKPTKPAELSGKPAAPSEKPAAQSPKPTK